MTPFFLLMDEQRGQLVILSNTGFRMQGIVCVKMQEKHLA